MDGFVSDQVINGTWGELWVDDTYMAEVISFKLEINPSIPTYQEQESFWMAKS